MKSLFIIRHGKAAMAHATDDFHRSLDEEGMQQTQYMAQRIKKKGFKPDLIISSPATRAISTARNFANVFELKENRIVDIEELYQSTTGILLRSINTIDQSFDSVFIFGHNPEFSSFVTYLCNEETGLLPTCGVAKIDFDIDDWQMVSFGMGKLNLLDAPKTMIAH